MAEYIDKEAVCEDAKTWFQTSDMKLYNDCVQMVRDRVTALPAADVRENVVGAWIWSEDDWAYKCSCCCMTFDYDKTYELFDHGFQLASFCPNCGARMGGAE